MGNTGPCPSPEHAPATCSPSKRLPSELPGSSELVPIATVSLGGAAPQTFPRFMDLPPELRIEIWKLSLPHRVHTFPEPVKKFHFLQERWTQGQVHGAKATQPPVIAHVCSEARTLVHSSGSVKKIMIRGRTKRSDKLGHVWIDSKRDTVVINLSRCIPGDNSRKLYKPRNHDNDHLYSLLRNRDMRIALDYSWVSAWQYKDQGRRIYNDLVRGLEECDFVILDLQLGVTDEEAARTGLFGEFGANRSVLIPIDDTRQMSKLFDAHSNFITVDFMKRWDNFNKYCYPTNLVEFTRRWGKLAARELRNVRRGLDYLTGVQVDTEGKDADQIREQFLRAAEIRRSHPKLRPAIMVSRGADGST